VISGPIVSRAVDEPHLREIKDELCQFRRWNHLDFSVERRRAGKVELALKPKRDSRSAEFRDDRDAATSRDRHAIGLRGRAIAASIA
jgi:hypothetical protein